LTPSRRKDDIDMVKGRDITKKEKRMEGKGLWIPLPVTAYMYEWRKRTARERQEL